MNPFIAIAGVYCFLAFIFNLKQTTSTRMFWKELKEQENN